MNEKIPIVRYPNKEMYSIKNYIVHGLFTGLYGFVKYLSFPFFNYFRFLILRLFTSGIKSTYINDGVTFFFPWRIKIGKGCSINQGSILDGTGGIEIGNNVRISSYVIINSTEHDHVGIDKEMSKRDYLNGKVIIEDDVWLFTHVIINKGVRIGKGAIIGAGSLVIKDIPPYSIAIGVPCEVVRNRE